MMKARRRRRRRRRRVEAVEERVDAEVDAVRSRRARHSRVCQARKRLGEDDKHRCCQYRTCKGGCTTRRRRRGDQQRRPPWTMAVAGVDEGEVEDANALLE